VVLIVDFYQAAGCQALEVSEDETICIKCSSLMLKLILSLDNY
jgi:hypothetical protein